jgi:hypothetical protein
VGGGGRGLEWTLDGVHLFRNAKVTFTKLSCSMLTSGFWPRVRARALCAPVFLGSLPRKTRRCAPPRPSQLRCFLFDPQKYLHSFELGPPTSRDFFYPLDHRGYEIGNPLGSNYVPMRPDALIFSVFSFFYSLRIFSFCYSLLFPLSFSFTFSSYSSLLILLFLSLLILLVGAILLLLLLPFLIHLGSNSCKYRCDHTSYNYCFILFLATLY